MKNLKSSILCKECKKGMLQNIVNLGDIAVYNYCDSEFVVGRGYKKDDISFTKRTYKMDIFGREYNCDNIHSLIADVGELETKIEGSVILSFTGLEAAEFHLNRDSGFTFIGKDCFHWLAYTWHKSKTPYFRERIMEFVDEDEEWTQKNNAGLSGIFSRKVTLNKPAQKALKAYLATIKSDLLTLLNKLEKRNNKIEAEREKRRNMCTVVNVYKDIKCKGGESGTDGYYDVDVLIKHNNKIVRLVCRNVFDFGVYNYPKRVEGTGNVFDKSSWESDELLVSDWASEFINCGYIRM